MRVDALDFHLPPELIAATAAEPRDAARLLVVSRTDPDRLEHRFVRDLPELLAPGDLLVTNDSRVIPARFIAVNAETGGKAEGLWLHDAGRDARGRCLWTAMVKARRQRAGRVLAVQDRNGRATGIRLEFIERDESEPGAWRLAAWDEENPGAGTPEMLMRVGLAPLPPYIRSARRDAGLAADRDDDLDRYQTVYAAGEAAAPEPACAGGSAGLVGSVAAPTAGLHFTPELLDRLAGLGVARTAVTLHVGTGTFKTVEAEDLSDHPMHTERCAIPASARDAMDRAARVIAVGTTAARTLEAFGKLPAGADRSAWLETELLIQPGHEWRGLHGLMTNFHLPRSTLLALVAALFPEGIDRVHAIYAEAIRERYRFFSFGDAMLILP